MIVVVVLCLLNVGELSSVLYYLVMAILQDITSFARTIYLNLYFITLQCNVGIYLVSILNIFIDSIRVLLLNAGSD